MANVSQRACDYCTKAHFTKKATTNKGAVSMAPDCMDAPLLSHNRSHLISCAVHTICGFISAWWPWRQSCRLSPPPGCGWEDWCTAAGHVNYQDHSTQTTTWDRPAPVGAAALRPYITIKKRAIAQERRALEQLKARFAQAAISSSESNALQSDCQGLDVGGQ